MCTDSFFLRMICGAGFEFCFHDTETFFNLPAFFIDSDNLVNPHILQVCAYGVKSIIHLFLLNDIGIQEGNILRTHFAIIGHNLMSNKTIRIILIFDSLFVCSMIDKFLCTFDLPSTDSALIPMVL